jgi:hypothetical protein
MLFTPKSIFNVILRTFTCIINMVTFQKKKKYGEFFGNKYVKDILYVMHLK